MKMQESKHRPRKWLNMMCFT